MLLTFSVLRWIGLIPVAVSLWLRRDTLDRPVLAIGVATVMAAYTMWAEMILRYQTVRLLHPRSLALGALLAAGVLAADGWVFGYVHTFNPPALGALWSLAAVLTVGTVAGWQWGTVTGVAVVAIRMLGVLAPEVEHNFGIGDILEVDGPRLMPTMSLLILYAVAGFGAGAVSRLLHQAEDEIADVRTREDLARTLHDGVLQALAIVQRRSTDPELVQLAVETDRDLRHFLSGAPRPVGTPLGVLLTEACNNFARRFRLQPTVVLDEGLEQVNHTTAQALATAVGEALTNIGKHAEAATVTVYAGADDRGGTTVTINDDGAGFDASTTPEGRGLGHSIREPIAACRGTVQIRSQVGQGSEVRLWVP